MSRDLALPGYAEHYAAMVRQDPDHYTPILGAEGLRELYVRDLLTLDEFERLLDLTLGRT